jgi:hypothetical protein
MVFVGQKQFKMNKITTTAATTKKVLSLYKEILKLSYTLPDSQSVDALRETRNEFRVHKNENDPTKIEELIKRVFVCHLFIMFDMLCCVTFCFVYCLLICLFNLFV